MATFETEAEMTTQLRGQMEADGWWCIDEVMMNVKWVDLVAIKQGDVWAIELKLRDWRRALDQARIYRLGADKAFVAMPQERLSPLDWNLFARWGVGVIAVREDGYDVLLEQADLGRDIFRDELLIEAKRTPIDRMKGSMPGWMIMNEGRD